MTILGDSPNHNPYAEELYSLLRELDKKLLNAGVLPKHRLYSELRELALTLELQEQRALLEQPLGEGAEELMKVPEVAKFLGKSPDWVYRHQDEIGAVYAGRNVRFHKKEVDAYLRNQKGGYS